ncbi:ATP-binding cassette domain-containing protein [Rhizobium sp. 2YAF20]|uniref:ATP-binding cassette domain-containing protein n=1 Tax=Rhizobium sp. 2YAF20 TaxID=3233027 RepID=UPI003F9B5D96
MSPLIELRSISKRFGGIEALIDVSIEVQPGEVLCLLGDNGAGKSTLIKVLSGFYQPTSGDVYVGGEATRFSGPREARSKGIATVHQDVGSIPLMSVGRNFFLGAEPIKGWGPFKIFDVEKANNIAVEEIRSFGITRVTSGDQLVGTLSGGERQVLAIARAMYFGAKVLILDEPTSALGVKEAAKVLGMVKLARKRGVGIVFITHNARHAMLVGDSFVVVAHGAVLAKFRRGEKTRDEVLNLMAGGDTTAAIEADLARFEEDAD